MPQKLEKDIDHKRRGPKSKRKWNQHRMDRMTCDTGFAFHCNTPFGNQIVFDLSALRFGSIEESGSFSSNPLWGEMITQTSTFLRLRNRPQEFPALPPIA